MLVFFSCDLYIFCFQVKDNLVDAIRKDPFVSVSCPLVRPEALCVGTQEEEDQQVPISPRFWLVSVYLTHSAT